MREAHFIAMADPGIEVDRVNPKLLAGSTAKAHHCVLALAGYVVT
jgi:hypothetical protein